MNVLVTGVSRIWAGILNPALGLKRAAGLQTTFFYLERREDFKHDQPEVSVVPASRRGLINYLQFHWLLKRLRPVHLDVYYHTGRWAALRRQLSLAHRWGVPMVSVCTGAELLNFEEHSQAQKDAIRHGFGLSKAIVIKELYMEEVIAKNNLAEPAKVHFCSNKIVVGEAPRLERSGPVALFLNLFKDFRRIDLIIKAAPLVLEQCPAARFKLVGSGRYPEREQELTQLIQQLGLEDRITVHPYTSDSKPFYEEASVFLLPADIVFCNNALLEAMERGTPAIVADVSGAERIVEHGISGLRIPQTVEALAEALIRIFKDEAYRLRLARGARDKIEKDFSEESRARFLLQLYRSKVWEESRPSAAASPAAGPLE